MHYGFHRLIKELVLLGISLKSIRCMEQTRLRGKSEGPHVLEVSNDFLPRARLPELP